MITNILETINVQGKELDIYGTKEEPLFLAVDVARLIDYSVGNTSWMLKSIDEDEKQLITVSARSSTKTARGNATQKWFLTEYGLYEVLMQSRKPVARRFKSSVKRILKDIRLRDEGGFEDWMNGPDPLVDEWEAECSRREENEEEDITFEDWLKECKGYTDDMI